MDPGAYCREVETYLCRKNDGCLIRIVGPAFAQVCDWAQAGVPLQVVTRGIDRKMARYHAGGQKRRPLRIEYCEADVLELFDEWRHAVGVTRISGPSGDTGDEAVDGEETGRRRRISLPQHLDRVIAHATNQLAHRESATGIHVALDLVITELDALRGEAITARGAARAALTERLGVIDANLIAAARTAAGSELRDVEDAARAELAPFRSRMTDGPFARALTACANRMLREHFRLPAILFD
jgi:hypothetical protein